MKNKLSTRNIASVCFILISFFLMYPLDTYSRKKISSQVSAMIPSDEKSLVLQEKHKFQQEFTFGRKLTFKQYYRLRFNNKFIPILQEIANDMGKVKFLEILKKASYDSNRKLGKVLLKEFLKMTFHFSQEHS